ncbi:MAG: RraA family protein [Terriglobus roseus]|nr:RraA family protein [Terriglobus roseus]
MSDPHVEALKAFSTCDVSDALQKLKYPHGGFLPDLVLLSPEHQAGATKVIGPAYTVRYVRKNYENEPRPTGGHYIDAVPRGAVVFVSSPAGTINAVYGGLMSTRAQAAGAAGTVVDGRVRDLQEHRDLGYPVFARSVGTPAPAEVVRVAEVNGPVRFQHEGMDVSVHAGDYIIGDLNGVVCLPKRLVEKVLDLMPSQVEADEKMVEAIKAGMFFDEASKKYRSSVKQP